MAESEEDYYARRLREEAELSNAALEEMEGRTWESFCLFLEEQVEQGNMTREEADELMAEFG